MDTTESLGYLKGLIEGLDLGDNKKETKVFSAIVDVLSNLVEDIDDMTDGVEMLADQVDAVDEDLADLEEYVYDDYDDECDCDDCCDDDDEDEEEFEVECPLCNTPKQHLTELFLAQIAAKCLNLRLKKQKMMNNH